LSQDILFNLRSISYNGSNYGTNADIKILANENQTISNRGGKIIFETTDLASTSPSNKLTIDDQVKIENDLVIGNSNPATSYTLPGVRAGAAGYELRSNGSGGVAWFQAANVFGPLSSTDNALVRFSGSSGNVIQDTTRATLDDLGNLAVDGTMSLGVSPTDYTLPNTRAASANRVLKDVLGDGVVSWEIENASSETLQEAYDVSPAYPGAQIETNLTSPVIKMKSHIGVGLSQRFFELTQSDNNPAFEVYSDGYVYALGLSLGLGGPGTYNFPINFGTGITESPMKLVGSNVVFEYPGYSQTSTIPVPTNDTIEHLITSSGAGSLIIPAGTIRAGSNFHLLINGAIRNQNSSANVRIRVKANNILIGDTNVISLDSIASLQAFECEWDFVFQSTGVSVAPLFSSQFTYFDNGYKGGMYNALELPINTTIDQTISVTWQWSTASFDNVAFVRNLRLTKEF
jgi:hypothetical protein